MAVLWYRSSSASSPWWMHFMLRKNSQLVNVEITCWLATNGSHWGLYRTQKITWSSDGLETLKADRKWLSRTRSNNNDVCVTLWTLLEVSLNPWSLYSRYTSCCGCSKKELVVFHAIGNIWIFQGFMTDLAGFCVDPGTFSTSSSSR